MKSLVLFLALLPQFVFALPSEYGCDFGRYHVDFDLGDDRSSTHLWLIDSTRFSTLGQGYAKASVAQNGLTQYVLYLPEGECTFTLKTEDVKNRPERFIAKIRGMAEGFIFRETIECSRR